MEGNQKCWVLIGTLVFAAAFPAYAQPPTINPQNGNPPGVQSIIPPNTSPVTVTGVTSGTANSFPNGFTLVLNGTFHPSSFVSLTWTNNATNVTTPLTLTLQTASTYEATVTPDLFNPAVSSPQSVTITVTESGGTATGAYSVNPPLAPPPNSPYGAGATGTILQPGTTGVAYAEALAQFGTPPYEVGVPQGSLPPGLPLPLGGSDVLTGTPTTPGVYTWTIQVVDAWSTSININEATEIVATPTGTAPLAPANVAAGSPDTSITFNGSNFVPAANPLKSNIPSTVVTFTPPIISSGPIPLATTFVSANQLTATVPQNDLTTPGSATVIAAQPSGATSNSLTLNIVGPAITSLSPSPATTLGTKPINLTVNGANFVQNPSELPVQSTVQIYPVGSSPSSVSTTFVSGQQLIGSQAFAPGTYSVSVVNPGGSQANIVTWVVLPQPAVTSVSPTFATAGTPAFLLTVHGLNFTNTMRIVFNGNALTTNFVNAGTLTATAPANLAAGNYPVTVITADNFAPASVNFPVYAGLQIITTSLPGATYQQSYSTTVAATGGLQPYTWTMTGPAGLAINKTTGVISGTITSTSSFVLTVTVTDANGTAATAPFTVSVTIPPPPIIFNPGTLPSGTVGVPYNAVLTATGGSGTITFSLSGGSLPPGLTLSPNGSITGTPTSFGTFNFNVTATDSQSTTATAGPSILIKPAPLTITPPANGSSLVVNSAVNLKFTASGGIPGYSFNFQGNLPTGTNLFRDGSLTGTATAVGTFKFTIFVTDSAGTQASLPFVITVTPPVLTATASLGNGQVGVSYSGNAGATGGQSPYTITVSGLPPGITFNPGNLAAAATANVTGIPTTAGTYTVTVSVTDAAGTQASTTATVVIAPAGLSITVSLGNGTVGIAYTGSASATGGASGYTFVFSGLPPGLTGSSSGSVSGIPTTAGPYTVTVTVTDSKQATAKQTANVTIAPATLTITSATISSLTVGTAVPQTTFTATGGAGSYSWSATGLPTGLTLSAAGVLSGTPTTPGPFSVVVTVKDSSGATATQNISVTVALPAAPPVTLTGLPSTGTPATQSTVQVGIGSPYPVDVTVTLTLTFAPVSGPDDPTVQFATGGRTATLIIPAGSLAPVNSVGVQIGTVAGVATITAKLTASGQNITPNPAPTSTVTIKAGPPVPTSMTATINGSGFTVTIVGFATTRSITSAVFTFTPASGANLQTTTLTVPVDTLFSAWYGSSAALPFGSQFTYTQPFNVQGGVTAIASVSVTLVNANGNSTAISATLH